LFYREGQNELIVQMKGAGQLVSHPEMEHIMKTVCFFNHYFFLLYILNKL